eukprot:COSAG01_NODE_1710_length_9422_cov_11.759412_7_plen_73_part_00
MEQRLLPLRRALVEHGYSVPSLFGPDQLVCRGLCAFASLATLRGFVRGCKHTAAEHLRRLPPLRRYIFHDQN